MLRTPAPLIGALGIMLKRANIIALSIASLCAKAVDFKSVTLSEDRHVLTIHLSDGTDFSAPLENGRFDNEQDEFYDPQVSPDGKYVGWLAAYAGLGTSYSMLAELNVMDRDRRVHYFHGDVGLTFEWCFADKPGEVVFSSRMAHGITDHDFDLSRIDDEKPLLHYSIPPSGPQRDQTVREAPSWFRCIPDWATR